MPPANSPSHRTLTTYRRKRDAGRTPEPFGGEGQPRPHLFTIQKHAARRMHYDFRLEWKGVLLSWAVPRMPSYDPKEKRLAVEVEDHPVEYADFEGVIPAGNYGAGGVIVWDRGSWQPLEDPDEGLKKGKLLFTLHGYKLRGEWTLVRTKRKGQGEARSKAAPRGTASPSGRKEGQEWLLIKHQDDWAGKDRDPVDTSILSGRTVEEVAAGSDRAAQLHAALRALGREQAAADPARVELMLAETRERPFDDPRFLFELKYDGYRLLARRQGGKASVAFRNGGDASLHFPDLITALAALPGESAILDGEVTVLDEEGRPSFQRLQQRARLGRAIDIARATVELPATFFIFDLIAFDGFDLRPLPLVERKRLLRLLLPAVGPLRYCDHVEGQGVAFFNAVEARGLEGIVAKRADAPYRGGRSSDWIKLRTERTCDLAVVGYARSERRELSALHVAFFDGERFVYCGRVGAGLGEAQLRELRARLDAARRRQPTAVATPSSPPLPKGASHVWSEPEVVIEVRFREWTAEGSLRQPLFLRVRQDKRPRDCTCGPSGESVVPAAVGAPPPEPIPTAARTVPFSNRDKVFWPDEGYTKGDLIDYYEAIAPWMLPYLRDRPLVLTRFPDGIRGKSFFQKDAPGYVPGWLRTERMWSEHAQREIDYFIADDLPSLLYLVNLGTIPIHVWASRVRTLPTPDWCIIDLDPKGAPFAHVIALARAVHALCDEIELPSYCKTSGATGLHVLLPLGRACSHEQATTLGELIARVVLGRHPELATIERVVARRGGKVYLDYLQNGHGKTIVAPYSARPVPGASVSMPLDWSEVGPRLDPRDFDLKSAPRRMKKRGRDPMAAVIEEAPRLDLVLARLAQVAAPGPATKPRRRAR